MPFSAAETDLRSFQETKSRLAQQVDDTGLHRRLWKDGGDRVGEALEAIDDGDQHILDAAVFQLVHDAQPEFGAFVLLEPQPEDFLGAVGPYAERDVDRLLRTRPMGPWHRGS